MTRWRSLARDEATQRKSLLSVTSYDVRLDLTTDDTTFRSITTVRFEASSDGGDTFADVKPVTLHRAALDGAELDPATLAEGRLPLRPSPGGHELVVEATMPFRNDGEGLHRSVDPADGRSYIYGMSFMDAAPTVFACFDQPDLKAPYTMHVTAPDDWLVVGNARAEEVGSADGVREWRLGPTPPLSTYFVTLVAGPYHQVVDEHDGIRLSLSSRQSLATTLDREAGELFSLTQQSFDELHRLFGIRYAFGDYHQAFVPEFNAGAMENPGCITIRDPLLFDRTSSRAERSYRAALIAHEMAHQWFGNLVTPSWWDDLWLNESFAEYVGYRVTATATPYDDAWVDQSYARRAWGLTADQRPTTHPVAGNGAVDALAALQDFDGISYARGSNVLRQLAVRLGDDVFFAGVRDHFERHRFGNATMHDLFDSWSRAGAGDLDGFIEDWLLTPGPDVLTLDRLHAGLLAAVERTEPGSELRLSAFRWLVATASDFHAIRAWADGNQLPEGIVLDDDLRWRICRRLAELGEIRRAELDAALESGSTGHALVEHARAVSSLPTAEGKEFAWDRLLGRVSVAMYEIEAAGAGFWRPAQQEVTQRYVSAYFESLPAVVAYHQGWVQGVAVESFFPITHLDDDTAAQARAALDLDLPPAALRRLRDQVDELERRRAVAVAFPI